MKIKRILLNIMNYLMISEKYVIILFNDRADFILMMEYALFFEVK